MKAVELNKDNWKSLLQRPTKSVEDIEGTVSEIFKEIKISYSGVENISYAMEMNSDFTHLDTICVFNIHWFCYWTN